MLCQVYKLLESIYDPNHVVSWTHSERHVAQESVSKCLSSLLLKTYSYDAVKLPMDFRRNWGDLLISKKWNFHKGL